MIAGWGLFGLSLVILAATAIVGKRPDRIAVGVLFFDMIASPLVQNVMIDDSRWAVALVDTLAALGLAGLTLRFDRWWLVLAAGLQVAVVLTHLAALGPAFVYNWTAVTLRITTWCAILLVLGLGAYESQIVRRYGLDAKPLA